jgi:Tol biopolymer transport system component
VERTLVGDPSISIQGTSSAGDRIYFGAAVATSSSTLDAFRVSRVNPSAGAAEILTTRAWGGRDYVLISPDERFLAADGSLYDLQAGSRTDLACSSPRGFSPDGTQLLCQNSFDPSPFSLVSTADGSSQPLHAGPSGSFYFGHRWEGNSPQLLDYALANGTTRIFETDGVTGTTRDLAQLNGSPTFLLIANWSPDGRTLGAWIEEGSGGDRRAKLYVIHTGSAPAVAASVNSNFFHGPDQPVFSPSGNSVAYFYYNDNNGRSLYAKTGI